MLWSSLSWSSLRGRPGHICLCASHTTIFVSIVGPPTPPSHRCSLGKGHKCLDRGWHTTPPQWMLAEWMTLVCCGVPEVLEWFIDLGILVLSSKLYHMLGVPCSLSLQNLLIFPPQCLKSHKFPKIFLRKSDGYFSIPRGVDHRLQWPLSPCSSQNVLARGKNLKISLISTHMWHK